MLLPLAGCGGSSLGGSGANNTIYIATQPASQSVPIGSSATFTVTVLASVPVTYQWSNDGVAIPGANSASYTTPAISASDSGSTYEVTISDPYNSVTSNSATLIAGARCPKQGDLRLLLFQQVGVSGLGNSGDGLSSNILAYTSQTIPNVVGSPLSMGTDSCGAVGNCAWTFYVLGVPGVNLGLGMGYKGHDLADFAADMQSITGPSVVLTSLDLEPVDQDYAVSWVETAQAGGFDYRLETVSPAQFPVTAAQDGAQSRVITAVSFDGNGQVDLVSYGWQGDTTTAYETQTVICAPPGVASAATTLAGEGYIISAFGGNDTYGYVLVGARVKGDTLPRTISVITPASMTTTGNQDSAYFTPVARLNSQANSTSTVVTITEQ